MPETNKQPFQVELARHLDVTPFQVDVIEEEQTAVDQVRQVEPEGGRIGGQLGGIFFKGQKDARLPKVARAIYQEFHGQQGLTASRPAHQQRRTALRQATFRNLVQSLNTGRGLGELSRRLTLMIKLL